MESNGDFVVVWDSLNQDGNNWGVYAQRFDNTGAATGTEFLVNSTTLERQQYSAVAMDADGDFVVVWSSFGQDGSSWGVYAQRFDNTGVAVGTEFLVNTTTANEQRSPTVAMDADGDFVVAWGSADQDGNGWGVYAQRYNNGGAPVGGEFLVNTTTFDAQFVPSVAMDADGDFVVAWASVGQDGSGWGVYAQRYDNSGATVGGEFLVNSTTIGDQWNPSVAIDADGDFVVAWESENQDGSSWGVYAQRFDNTGAPVGSEFLVNTTTNDHQLGASVAIDEDGDFVVGWMSFNQDGSSYGVYAQRFDSNGAAVGTEFLVNSTTPFDQAHPTLAMETNGAFVVAWGSLLQDGDGWGIYAQRYASAGPTPPANPPTQVWVDSSWSGLNYGDDPTGPATFFGWDAFATPQDAVNIAAPGATITLAAATYPGFNLNKSVNLVGAGIGNTIIRGASPALTVSAPGTTASGMTFEVDSAPTPDDPTILITGGDLTIDTSLVVESGSFNQAAFRLTGGALVFGAGVTINRQGAGQLIDHQVAGAINATGVTLQNNGAAFANNFAIEDAVTHALDSTGPGLVTWFANNLYVTPASGSIQRAVDAATATNIVNVQAGTYDEHVSIGKALTISGPNFGTSGTSGSRVGEATVTRTGGGMPALPLFEVTASNVVIDGLRFVVDLAHARGAVRANGAGSGANFIVRNNIMLANGASTPGSYGVLSTDATGNPLITRNLVGMGAGLFNGGVVLLTGGGTIGGAAPAANQIRAESQDIDLVATSQPVLVRSNTLLGAGAVIDGPSAAVTFQENTVTPVASTLYALQVKRVSATTVDVLGNFFTGHTNVGVLSGASSGVTLTNNSFTPDSATPNFTHVLVSSSFPSTSPTSNPANSITLLGNDFFNAGTAVGRAIDFQHHNDNAPTSDWGTIIIGNSTSPNENVFDGALSQYIRLQLAGSPFLAPTFTPGGSPTPGDFDVDLDAEFNTFNGIFPTSMTTGERATLESKVFHKVDNANVGLIDFGFNYIPTLTTVSNLGPTNEDVELNIPYATLLGATNANDVDGTVNALRVTAITGLGVLEITPIATGVRVSVVLPQVVLPGDILHWNPTADLNNTNNAGPANGFSIVARDNVGAFSTPAVSVFIDVNAVNDAPVANGPASLTVNEEVAGPVNLSFTDVDMAEGADTARVTLDVSFGVLNLTTPLGGTITFNSGANGTASMDFQGSRAHVLAAIATVTYTPNLNHNDFYGSESIDFEVFDLNNFGSGGVQSDSVVVPVTVNALNDAPVATGPASLTLDEDTTDTVNLSFSDVDIDEIGTPPGIAVFTLSATNGTLTLFQTIGLTLLSGAGTGSGFKTMQYSGSTTDINNAVATVTYAPDLDYSGGDTIVFNVNDQGGVGAGGAQNDTHNVAVTVDPVNDAPQLTTVNPNLLPTANEDTQLVFGYGDLQSAADESDVDNATINFVVTAVSSGTLTVNSGAVVLYPSIGFTVIQSGDTIEWTPPADENNDTNGGNPLDAFEVRAYDGSADSGSDIQVSINTNAVNDAPVLSGTTVTLNYNENDPATVISPAANLIDIDSPDMDTGFAWVTYISGGGAQDQLAIANSLPISTAPGAPGFIDVLDGATVFGSYPDAGPGSGINGAALQVSLNANSTPARVQALLQRVTYENTSDTPAPARSVQYTISDGDTGVDNASTTLIQVTAINDAPTITAGSITGAFEDVPFDMTFGDLVTATGASDLDGSVVGFTVASLVSGVLLQIDEGLGFVAYSGEVINGADVLRWQGDADANGLLGAFNVQAVDDGSPLPAEVSTSELISIDVAAVNDAPSFTPTTATPTVDEDAGPSTFTGWAPGVIGPNFDAGGGTDEDTQAPLSYNIQSVGNAALFTAGGQPAITLVGSDWDLTFEPELNQNGSSTITVRVTDDGPTGGLNVNFQDIVFTITVTAINDEPSFASSINLDPYALGDNGPHTIVGWATSMFKGGAPTGQPGNEDSQSFVQFNLNTPVFSTGNVAFVSGPSIDVNTGDLTFELNPLFDGIIEFGVTLEDDGAAGPAPNDNESQPVQLIIARRQATVYVDVDNAPDAYGTRPPSGGNGNYVGIDAFAVVQDGVDHVALAGTVVVDTGTYGQASVGRSMTLDMTAANVVLTGTTGSALDLSGGTVIVDGGALDQQSADVALNVETDATIDDLVVTQNGDAYAVFVDANAQLTNCTIESTNGAFSSDCVRLEGGTVVLTTCLITQAQVEDAVRVWGGDVTLDGCTITQNADFDCVRVSGGVATFNSATAALSINQNGAGRAFFVNWGGEANLDGITINQDGDGDAMHVTNGGDVTVSGTTIFESSTAAGLCIFFENGDLDLQEANPNSFHIRGTGGFIDCEVGTNDVDAVGNDWLINAASQDETTRSGGFTVEDGVLHAIDDAARGLVRWDADSLYVTQNSGSIQRGVDNSNPGDFLEVDIGLFTELVVIPLSLTVTGNQASNPGSGRLPVVPANETILLAPGGSTPGDAVVRVLDDDVTIDGLVIDGNSAAGTGVINNPGLGFVDIDNLLLDSNVLQNFVVQAVRLSGAGAVTEHEVRDNAIVAPGLFGVSTDNDMFVDIYDNRIEGFSAAGVRVQNYTQDRATDTIIEGNTLDVADGTVAIELISLNLVSTSPIEVNTNTINANPAATGAPGTIGISLRTVGGVTDLTLTDNQIGATGGVFDRGISLWDLSSTPNVSFSNGSVGNSTIGVHLHSVDALFGVAANDTIVDFNGLTTAATCTTAVQVLAVTSGSAPTSDVRINFVNTSISASNAGIGVDSDTPGVTATVNVSMSDATAPTGALVTGQDSFVDFSQFTVTTTGVGIDLTDGQLDLAACDIDSGAEGVLVRAGGQINSFTNNYVVSAVAALRVLAGAGTISAIDDNNFDGSASGIDNQSGVPIDAEDNWWGSTRGPTHAGNLGGNGSGSSDDVDYSPWWASGNDDSPAPGFQGGDNGPSLFGDPRHAIPTRLEWSIMSPNGGHPPDGTAGIALSPSPTVRAEDANGILGYNWDTTNSDAFLVFVNNPTGASIQGNPVIQAANGYAIFSNVAISTGGVAFTVKVIGDYGVTMLTDSPPSLPFDIDNFVPVVSTVTPDFIHEGAGSVTLQVDDNTAGVGTYNLTTVVLFNGSPRPTFFVNPKRLLVALTNTDTATANIGSHTIQVQNPSPGGGTTAPLPFTVNDIPDDLALSPTSVAENQIVGTTVGAFSTIDTPPTQADTHTYSLVAGVGAQDNGSFQISGANLQTSAVFDFEIKSSYSIRVRTTDSLGAWFEKVFIITVTNENEAPTAVADSFNMNEDGVLNVAAPGLLANDTDPDSPTVLTAALVPASQTPAGSGVLVVNGNGSFDFTPTADFFGVVTFQYTITDNGVPVLGAGPVTVTITVNPVNDAPSFTLAGATASDEDAGPQTFAAASTFNPGTGESDVVLAYEITNNTNPALFSAQPAINLTGQLSYTAAANANGSATLDVRVRDNGGTANGGVDVSGTQQITITVNPINDAPSFTVAPSNSIITRNEDSGLVTITNWASFVAGPANESGQSVLQYNISNVSNAGLLAGGAPSVANNGTLTFTPAANQNGSTTFDVSVTDDDIGPGVNTSPVQTFTIQITPVNDAPTLTTVAQFPLAAPPATEDTPYTITFGDMQTAANEADVDGDPVSFRIDSLIGGTLTMNGNPVIPGTTIFSTGSLVWTPPSNQNGVLNAFTILAWDGLLDSGTPVTVTVNVTGSNDAPVISTNALLSITENDVGVFVDAAHLTTTDLEDGPGSLTYVLTVDPQRGTLRLNGTALAAGTANDTWTQGDINNDLLTYDHDGSEQSTDAFQFDVSDTGPLTVSGTFNISIAPVNDAPTLSAGTVAAPINEDTWVDLDLSTLISITGATDVDGSVVGFTASGLSAGTLQIDQTGTTLVFVNYTGQVIDGSDILRWTPPLNANGAFTPFNVTAIDNGTPGSATSAAAVGITINVTPVNDIPSLTLVTPASVPEDTPGTVTITNWVQMNPGGGIDEAGQTPSSFSAPTNLSNPGLFSTPPSVAPNGANGDLSFVLTPNAFGTCTFDITVTDNGTPGATSAVQTFSIAVTPVNDAPTLSFISTIFGGPEDSPITVPFAILQGAANEADIDSSPVNFLLESVSNGSATIDSGSGPVAISGPTVFTVSDTLVWTPSPDINGTIIAFQVRAWDGALASSTVLPLRIYVEPVNDQPSFTASNPPASLEDAGAVTVIGWSTFDAGPPNEDTTQAVLNYTVSNVTITSGTLAFLSGPTIDNNGNLHYQAVANTNGTATFRATVRDTGGTASGGVDTSVLSAAFTITVTAVNDAPDFSTTGNPAAVNEDSGAATVTGWASVVSFGPADENSAPQAVQAYLVDQVSNAGLFAVAPAVDNSGNLTYTPDADAFGTSTFRVRLQDNGGTANGGVDISAGQTFTITVNPVNDAPSVTGGSNPTVAEDAGPQTISNFVGINPGPANESGQAAALYTVNVTGGAALLSAGPTINTAGQLSFTPAADANGTVTFAVTVQDNGGTANGGTDTSAPSGTFTITITPVNDAPTLTTVTQFTGVLEDTPFTITYAALVAAANEADIDSTPVNFQVGVVTNGSLSKGGSPVIAGSTTLAAGESWVWTPALNENGTLNAFTVAAWDGSLASSPPVQVQIQVTAVNDIPEFTKGSNVTVAWDQGPQSIPGWASGITPGLNAPDEAGQTLTFNITGNTNPGLFSTQPSVSSAGTLTFTPALNVTGTTSISLELQDNGGTANGGVDTSGPQSFTITISTAGDIDIDRGATPVADGASDNVGTTVPVLTPLNLTYTITNVGNGVLQLTNTTTPVVILGTTNCDAWITHQPATTLVTTTSTDFVVHIVPLTAGPFDVDLVIDNTDANEDPYDITIDGTAVDAPNIGLHRGFNADIPAGASDKLGVIPVAVATGFTYVVRNDGTADLTFGSPAVSTSAELNCSVAITQPVGPITAGNTENLVIDVTPTVTGIFSFTLEINSNDPDEDPFLVHVSGSASANSQPELELFGRFVLAPMDTENVGLIPSGSNTTFLYEVRNVGAAPLTVTNPVVISNTVNCVAIVTSTPGTNIAPGNMTILGIDVQPFAPGVFQFNFELITNDADESPLPVTVTGMSTASVVPEIAVDRDGTPITSGATDDIGDLPLNVYSTFIYRVRNEGTSTLNVNRPVTVSGETNCEVFIWTFPDVNIAPQDDSLLIVGIRPLGTGALGAILSISNNDSNEGNYLIDIIGTGPEADIRVESPEFTPIASGDPLTMAGGKAGSTIPLNVWVRNVGTGNLNITGVSASSEVNCTATVVSAGSTPVAPGTATTLTLDVVPAASGAFSFTLTISTNDPDTGNYVIFVSGTASSSKKGGGGGDEGCSTGEGSTGWLLLLAALSALVVATRTVRTRKS